MMQVPNATTRYRVSMRSIMSAGEQVGAEVFHWADEALGVKVNEMWGQTETNYLVGNCSAIMEVRPGSMGKPYPGHTVGVIDDAGNPVDDGTVGELAPRRGDPVMFLGYWGREDATREKFTGDWFRTGDLGYRDCDGYHWFMGRKDDVISSAGHRIGPGEIEDCLLKHPAVRQAAVVGSSGRAARATHQGVHRARAGACRLRCAGRGHPAKRAHASRRARVSARGRVHRRAADDHDRQGAADRAARAGD